MFQAVQHNPDHLMHWPRLNSTRQGSLSTWTNCTLSCKLGQRTAMLLAWMKCKLVHSLCFLSAWPFGPPFTLTLFDSIQSTFDLRLKEGWFGLGFVTVAAVWDGSGMVFGPFGTWSTFLLCFAWHFFGWPNPRLIHDAKNSQYFRNYLRKTQPFYMLKRNCRCIGY